MTSTAADQIYAAFLYGVNIPSGVRLSADQVRSALDSLPSDRARFLRFVGDVDNFLFVSARTDDDDSSLRQMIQRALDSLQVRCLVVLKHPTLRSILDGALEELHSRGFSLPTSTTDEWEYGFVFASEPLPASVRGEPGLFAPRRNAIALRVLEGRALLVQKRRRTANGTRIMFGSTVIVPWQRNLTLHGVSVACLTSRALGLVQRVAGAVNETPTRAVRPSVGPAARPASDAVSRAREVLAGEVSLLVGQSPATAKARAELERLLASMASREPEIIWRDARRSAVALTRLIFEATDRVPERRPLDELLRELSDHGLLSRKAVAYLHTIRIVRNVAEYSGGTQDFHEGDIEIVALMVQEVIRDGRRRRYW